MKEDHRSFIGVFKVPCYKGEAGNKALEIFTKLKQKAKKADSTMPSLGQVTPLGNIAELQQTAMNSYCIGPEVIKTDGGVEVV